MSYKVSDLSNFLEKLFPLENAMEYDNPGLLAGSSCSELKGILLTLDCTSDAVKAAVKNGANIIIAHHPLIFGGIDNVCCDNTTGAILTSLIKNDIALYACHTQLDCTDEFGNIEIAKRLGGDDAYKLREATIGVCFDAEKTTVKEFSKTIIKGLDCSGTITISSPDTEVSKVFCQGGSFDEDNIDAIKNSGADLVVTGEMKHHHMVLLKELGISVLLCGHNASERVYLPRLKTVLEEQFPDLPIFVDFGNETTLL